MPNETNQQDLVNHPAHYTHGKIECIDAIESALGPKGFIAFLQGQVIKYQWRIHHKKKPQEDAAKAVWYATKLQEVLRKVAAKEEINQVALATKFATEVWQASLAGTPKEEVIDATEKVPLEPYGADHKAHLHPATPATPATGPQVRHMKEGVE